MAELISPRTMCQHIALIITIIAVDDPLLVRGLECLRDLFRDRQGLVEWDRSLCDAIRQRRTFDEFEDQRGDTVRVLPRATSPDRR